MTRMETYGIKLPTDVKQRLMRVPREVVRGSLENLSKKNMNPRERMMAELDECEKREEILEKEILSLKNGICKEMWDKNVNILHDKKHAQEFRDLVNGKTKTDKHRVRVMVFRYNMKRKDLEDARRRYDDLCRRLKV